MTRCIWPAANRAAYDNASRQNLDARFSRFVEIHAKMSLGVAGSGARRDRRFQPFEASLFGQAIIQL
jgi:hypothetical protein